MFEATYLKHIADQTRLFPGWQEVLSQLGERKAVILTNKIQLFTNALVKALGLEKYFLAAYGREAFAERKPSPFPVLRILENHNTKAEMAIMIGDMPADIRSGQSAGVPTCAALFGYGAREVLLELSPTSTIEQPNDLIQLLGIKSSK